MTELRQIYKCAICGNIVEVLHTGAGQLVCCGEPMRPQKENTEDAATEKHKPVAVKQEKAITVKVGSVEHPMTDEHHIEWIEAFTDKMCARKSLAAGEKPEAEFNTDEDVKVRAYCNLHGLWS